jgi:4-alpha-glucanotransferase
MRSHGLMRTWVLQASLRPRAAETVAPVPSAAVASLNTHDMFPFAGFLRGDDIEARVEIGQLGAEAARRQAAARRRLVIRLAEVLHSQQGDEVDLVVKALTYLAASPAKLVLVSLEDLLLETRPQNIPGTGSEQANWRRKMAVGLETALDFLG